MLSVPVARVRRWCEDECWMSCAASSVHGAWALEALTCSEGAEIEDVVRRGIGSAICPQRQRQVWL
jgi:hypothetical protein